jgi:hypothetical protein
MDLLYEHANAEVNLRNLGQTGMHCVLEELALRVKPGSHK